MKSVIVKLLALTLFPVVLCAPVCRAADSPQAPGTFNGATPLQWSERMADSEMARRGHSLEWTEGGKAKWDYAAGLFALSLLELYPQEPHRAYFRFADDAVGSFVTPEGNIHGYKLEEYSLDNIAPGRTLLDLYLIQNHANYRTALEKLYSQFAGQPRTDDGGFWHKKRYPHQMWLDGLYMGEPFYAEYTKSFNGPATNYDDVARQFRLIDEHLYDAKSGLFYHGWDSAKTQGWANPVTGASSNYWGRAIGWYAMACVDVLDDLPADHPARKEIIGELKKVSDGIVKWQDADSGVWWQVVDQGGRPGNYLEATASSMYVYAVAKGVNKGYLARDYVPAILKGYQGILTKFIQADGDKVSLTHCCQVAGLGGSRDGSFSYYISEPVVTNDLKGVGPFILAGIQVQQLIGAAQ